MNTDGAPKRVEYAADDVALTFHYYEETMGYTTDFDGRFTLDKPLTEAHAAYLKAFGDTRRMRRDAALTATRSDPLREAVGLPVGVEGEFFVNEGGHAGQGDWAWGEEGTAQKEADGIVDSNRAPSTQPGLWCQWEPSVDKLGIGWDGSEKFYDYVEWLNYLNENFLKPWGYKISGEVSYQGEEHSDCGRLVIVGGICKRNPGPLVQLAECAGDLTDEDF